MTANREKLSLKLKLYPSRNPQVNCGNQKKKTLDNMPPRGNGYRGCPGGRPLLFDDSSAKFDPIRSVHDKRVEVVVDSHITHSHIQRIVLASEETTATQRVNHRPIKCQSRSWSQRGTEVNDSHHGDSPLLLLTLTGPNRGKTLVRFNHPKTSETERRLDDIYLWVQTTVNSYCHSLE